MGKMFELTAADGVTISAYRADPAGRPRGGLVVAGLAARAGVHFRFVTYLKVAFPLMLISIVLSHVYIWLRYL